MQLFDDDPAKLGELRRMKLIATGLLAAAALVFVAALLLEPRFPWLGFVRAFAEASMVGALADWFAVTALFRHPLGLPVPHTAIIPRRKDSIGENIGLFVQDNFLSEDVLLARMRSMHVIGRAAQWISQPDGSERLARYTVAVLGGALRVVNDDDIQQLLERSLRNRLQTVQPAPLLGRVLGTVLRGERQQELVDELIRLVAHLTEENKDVIRRKIREETPWWLPRAVDRHISERLFDTIESTVREVSADPAHPFHEKFNAVLSAFIVRLQHDSVTIARGEALKQELLQSAWFADFVASLWADIKAALQEQSANPGSTLHVVIARWVRRFGELMLSDPALAAKVERWVERMVVYVSREYRHQFGQLIAHTVSRWDSEATSRKIELQIGRDLQFIRINGTIVGGIAGLVIYSVSLLLR